MFEKPSPEFIQLLKASASGGAKALEAQDQIAKAMEMPLRQAILVGDLLQPYQSIVQTERVIEYPIDLLNPGQEDDFVAYTNPGHGRIPEKTVEGDYLTIPTYGITSSIDFLLRYARDAGYDVVGRALQVMRDGFVRKLNNDGWATLIAAAADRNIVVYDADANGSQFTKRLVSLMRSVMARNAGGNSASLRKGRLTDLYMSVEGHEDIRNWNADQVDEVTRREIYSMQDGQVSRIFGVNLHEMYELGVDQEYQLFFEDVLGGTLPAGDTEIVVGIDNQNPSFLMPIREELSVHADPNLHRSQKQGYYGWMENGFGVLDNRDVILGSM
jgi:hypothetical protein